ncbi:MAG TPA: hypothetical protein VM694_40805 [Polyangium sp.]|nr:hypothetical protein [Polyangium sp.]
MKADVVLLDSRAGLHDIAAFTVTRLRAHALLFAVGTSQTWNGYKVLFDDWMRHPDLDDLRERLHIAAALVPETGRADYMKRFVDDSYDLFADRLYDEADPKRKDTDPFNFDVSNEAAPHYPISIYWNRALQEFDPVRDAGRAAEDQVRIASEEFCQRVASILGLKVTP